MSYLVLARKWRPSTFDEVVGQEGVIRTLRNAIRTDRVAHAYLFCGVRGVGKTTVARLLAKALNCEQGPTPDPDNTCGSCREITSGSSPDVFEIDGASNTGVDDVRSLRENSRYLPARSRFKIYIIDEVHMLSTSAFNALLKTLEEPPEHVKFVFATTEPHKIPLTVLSRCQRFDFKRIPSGIILERLQKILSAEGAAIDAEGLRIISREAAGSMRDALSLTDQVLAFAGDKVDAEQVYAALGLARSQMFATVIDCVIEQRSDDLMRLVEELFDEGHDLKRFLDGLLWHVRNLILYRSLEKPASLVDALEEERSVLRAQAGKAEALRWHQLFDVLVRALSELSRSPYPRLTLETALLRLSAVEPLVEIGSLVNRVAELSRGIEGGKGRGEPPREQGQGGGRTEKPARPAFIPPTPKATANVSDEKKASPSPRTQPVEKPATQAVRTSDGFPKEWQKLVAMVSRRRPSLGSVLNHAYPLEVAAERVRIALEPGSFFADQMKVERNKRELEKYCQELFGQETRLSVEDHRADQGVTLAQALDDERQTRVDEQRNQALSHPMVKEAIKIFGAEVAQVKTTEERKS